MMYLSCGIIFDDIRSAIEYARERHEKFIEEIQMCGMKAWRRRLSVEDKKSLDSPEG